MEMSLDVHHVLSSNGYESMGSVETSQLSSPSQNEHIGNVGGAEWTDTAHPQVIGHLISVIHDLLQLQIQQKTRTGSDM